MVQFNMATKVFVLNNLVDSVNSVSWLHHDAYQRRSPFRLLGGTRSRGAKSVTDLAAIR
jgi:hypothetical protein